VARANVPTMLAWKTQHKLAMVFVRLFLTGRISGATSMETINDPNQFN
jgi:hypothetical protein